MITRYPALDAILEKRGVEAVAEASGVPAETIRSWTPTEFAASIREKEAIGRALRRDPNRLFRLRTDRQPGLDAAPTRYVTDRAALRTIHQATSR